MLFTLQLEKSQISYVVLSGLTWSTVPTFLNHLLTIASASAFFSSTKKKKKPSHYPSRSSESIFLSFYHTVCALTILLFLLPGMLSNLFHMTSSFGHYYFNSNVISKEGLPNHHPSRGTDIIPSPCFSSLINTKFMHLPVLLLTMNHELHKSKELWLCCMQNVVQGVFSSWHIVETQLTRLSKWINRSKCQPTGKFS